MDNDLHTYSRDKGALGPGLAESAYPARLGGLRSNYSILPTKPHPGSAPVRSFTDGAESLDSVDSLLAAKHSGQLSQNGMSDSGSVDDVTTRKTDRLQFVPNPLEHVSTKTRGIQLPVKHTNQHGMQIGILLPKYHTHPQSKCIMCRDCGIFFSHDSFLRHLHDNIGRRKECQSTMLELGIDNPGVHQLKLWDDFLAKLRGESNKRPRLSSYDPSASSSIPLRGSRSYSDSYQTPQPPLSHRPATLNSPRTSMHSVTRSPPATQPQPPLNPTTASTPREHSAMAAQQGPVSDFNRNIQHAVDASQRLLRETSHFLASTEKSRHRRNRSVNLDLGSSAAPAESKPQASRSLFSSTNEPSNHNHALPSENGSNSGNPQAVKSHEGAAEIESTRFPPNTRVFAGGDLPKGISRNGAVNAERISRNGAVNAERGSLISDEQSQSTRRGTDGLNGISSIKVHKEIPRLPLLNGGVMSDQERQEYKKQDPVFILQTAQELLSLACHRVQVLKEEGATGPGPPPPSPGRDNEFLQLYHEERSKRRKYETQLQELQESLKEEQKQRKELEIQLRALNLQR